MEIYPYVDINERFILYCSNKDGSKGTIQKNGYYNTDIYISRYNGSFFQKNKALKTLSASDTDETTFPKTTLNEMKTYINQHRRFDLYHYKKEAT